MLQISSVERSCGDGAENEVCSTEASHNGGGSIEQHSETASVTDVRLIQPTDHDKVHYYYQGCI